MGAIILSDPDTPEQRQACLHCPLSECLDCFGIRKLGHPEREWPLRGCLSKEQFVKDYNNNIGLRTMSRRFDISWRVIDEVCCALGVPDGYEDIRPTLRLSEIDALPADMQVLFA